MSLFCFRHMELQIYPLDVIICKVIIGFVCSGSRIYRYRSTPHLRMACIPPFHQQIEETKYIKYMLVHL